MLAGPLPGIYDPTGPGKLLFAFFAAMAETERENIRDRSHREFLYRNYSHPVSGGAKYAPGGTPTPRRNAATNALGEP